jgi:hypothetical protein
MTEYASTAPSNARLRWNAIQRIARQQTRDTLLGWGFYITAALAALIAAILVYNSVRFTGESGLNIVSRPFLLPMQAAVALAILYVTIEATLVIARPREQGSLQILFCAPIDEFVLLQAYLLAGVLLFALLSLLLAPVLLLVAAIGNFVIPAALFWGLIPMILVAAGSLAFGLFLSAAAPTSRSAILLLVGALLILLILQAAYAALLNVPPTARFYDALIFLRVLLRSLQQLLSWVSPFRMSEVLLDAALRNDWARIGLQAGIALLGALFWLLAAVWALRRRGVLP